MTQRVPARHYAIITDSNLVDSHAASVTESIDSVASVSVFNFTAGEANKTRATWAQLTDEMLEAGFGRDSVVIAVGGGVVGDIAGFVAATYMRGIPIVQIPTTLLALIDSSIGGKTGVSVSAGKNLVGTFHQPSIVLSDPETLATLPEDELRNGLAEAIKHGVIADEEYFETIATLSAIGSASAMEKLVTDSIRIKAALVSEDELENGKRAILNFGHTVGHAVELATEFSTSHGEAVSIGMVAEARVGESLGITAAGTCSRIQKALSGIGLPTSVPPEIDPVTLVSLMTKDKKSRADEIRLSLLETVGSAARENGAEWTHEVAESVLIECLNQVS